MGCMRGRDDNEWRDCQPGEPDLLRTLGVGREQWNRLTPANRKLALEALRVVRVSFQSFTAILGGEDSDEPAMTKRALALLRRLHRAVMGTRGPRSLTIHQEIEERASRARRARPFVLTQLEEIVGEDRRVRRYLLADEQYQEESAHRVNDELGTLGLPRVCGRHHIRDLAHKRPAEIADALISRAIGVPRRRVRRPGKRQ